MALHEAREELPEDRMLSGATLAAGLATAAALGVGAYSVLVEPRWLEVTETEIPLPRLPRALDGLRIAHLSDLHLSRLVSRHYLQRCIRVATEAGADLALVTGDFVTRSRRWIPGLAPLLGRLRARHGVYAILGNHDHYVSADGVAEAVASAGVRMLRNRHVCLTVNGTPLWLVGIDSMRGKQYRVPPPEQARVDRRMSSNLDRALEGVDPAAFRILLAHSPDILPQALEWDVDLVLSGHTHGGQVRFPVVGATVVPSRFGARYAAGLFVEGNTRLYVTRGLGVVRLPIRFLCRPELSLLTLRRA
jgi:predicted MPP superfamily phosphohydrolase